MSVIASAFLHGEVVGVGKYAKFGMGDHRLCGLMVKVLASCLQTWQKSQARSSVPPATCSVRTGSEKDREIERKSAHGAAKQVRLMSAREKGLRSWTSYLYPDVSNVHNNVSSNI